MKTAHWIYTGEVKFLCHIYTCSNCGNEGAGSMATSDPEPPFGNYCKWCGLPIESEEETDADI